MPFNGSISTCHDALSSMLQVKVMHIKAVLAHLSPAEGSFILLLEAIPCFLHCENRCGEKILRMLLIGE